MTDAGWHPDPTGRYEYRYWDGSAWSAHVSQDGGTASDPLDTPPAASTPLADPISTASVAPATAAPSASSTTPPRTPRVLAVWVSQSAARNLEFGLKNGVWGFKKPGEGFTGLRSGDWVLLTDPTSGDRADTPRPRGWPRVQPEEWTTQEIARLHLGRVTSPPRADRTPLWPDEVQAGEVIYPHRFEFALTATIENVSLDPTTGQLGANVSEALRLSVNGGTGQLTDAIGSIFPGAEQVDRRYWLFQANPEIWSIDEFLARAQPGDPDTWLANQSRKEMKVGDHVVVWKSGPSAGAYAFAELTGEAFERPRSEWNHSQTSTEWAVPMRVIRVLAHPILRSELLEHPILRDLGVIKFANATNFTVTPEQWEALMALTEPAAGAERRAAPDIARTVTTPDPMKWLEDRTLWSRTDLEELISSLSDETPQIVLAGPPGTGKTWIAMHLARFLTGEFVESERRLVQTVQFHPTYGYEEFVEGLRPATTSTGTLEFERVDGIVLRLVGEMRNDSSPRVLVIDEMNRANLPRVFGELMFLTEYRDTPINLIYSKDFSLPVDLYLIGTMNTADRSIRSVDVALRRRFDFFDVPPSAAILQRFYEKRPNTNHLGNELYEGFESLNRELTESLDRHHTIGHTFFMRPEFSSQTLTRVWRHQIGPLIEEYFFDQPDVASGFRSEKYWPSATA